MIEDKGDCFLCNVPLSSIVILRKKEVNNFKRREEVDLKTESWYKEIE